MAGEHESRPTPEEIEARARRVDEENEERQRVVQEILSELDYPEPADKVSGS